MAKFTKDAQDVIDRLAALNYDEPYFNLAKVVEAFEEQYKLLGLKMPEVEVVDNMIADYEIAQYAWNGAWEDAIGAVKDAASEAASEAGRDGDWEAARRAARGAARGAVRGAVKRGAWNGAWDAVWHAAMGAASLNTGLKDGETLRWVKVATQELKALESGLGYFFPRRDKLILVPLPRMIISGGNLHYDHGKAVEWADGTGFYFLRGVRFDDEQLYCKIVEHNITAEEVMQIRNSDQRMAAISMLRPDRLLDQLGAKLTHVGVKGTKLYEVKDFMGSGSTEYCIWMKDASTPREFVEWVDPKVGVQGDADLCQANAWGICLEDYLLMSQEA